MSANEETRETIESFIGRLGLTMSSKPADANPNMEHDDWHDSASHYRCTIRLGKRRMTVYFSQGMAHHDDPALDSVLNCLALESAGVEEGGFEEWARNLGYDEDSRRAEKAFRVSLRQTERLRGLLGEGEYRRLLYETESL